jgi:hypothetical protein
LEIPMRENIKIPCLPEYWLKRAWLFALWGKFATVRVELFEGEQSPRIPNASFLHQSSATSADGAWVWVFAKAADAPLQWIRWLWQSRRARINWEAPTITFHRWKTRNKSQVLKWRYERALEPCGVRNLTLLPPGATGLWLIMISIVEAYDAISSRLKISFLGMDWHCVRIDRREDAWMEAELIAEELS